MPEMQKAISRLRFLLAAIKDKQKDLESLSRQFRRQLDRSANNSIHGDNPLDVTLGIMEEIRERLDNVEKTREHLAAINMRAQDELQALELTDKIEHAKAELATLRADQGPDEQDKVEALERFIQEASIRAGQAITGELNFEAAEPGEKP